MFSPSLSKGYWQVYWPDVTEGLLWAVESRTLLGVYFQVVFERQ